MRLALIGHGLRGRQVRGPRVPEGPPITVVIPTRRFLCVECTAVVTVAPRGVVRQRHFGAAAIGLALFLYGVLERSARGVQRAISGWGPGASCWRTLARWIEAARARSLLRAPRAVIEGLTRHQVAGLVGRSVQALAAASAGGDLDRVFAGSELLR